MQIIKIIRGIIIFLLVGIPVYFLLDKNPSDTALLVLPAVYALIFIVGVYARYFFKSND